MSDAYREFEKFCKHKGLKPCGRADTAKGDIYLAETFLENDDEDFPNGYYQTFWCLVGSASQGKLDGGSWLMFDKYHDWDKGWTEKEKREARTKTTLEQAVKWLNDNIEVGRFH